MTPMMESKLPPGGNSGSPTALGHEDFEDPLVGVKSKVMQTGQESFQVTSKGLNKELEGGATSDMGGAVPVVEGVACMAEMGGGKSAVGGATSHGDSETVSSSELIDLKNGAEGRNMDKEKRGDDSRSDSSEHSSTKSLKSDSTHRLDSKLPL